MKRDGGGKFHGFIPPELETYEEWGGILVGTPEQVREKLENEIEATGVNYIIAGITFGDISHDHAMRTLHLLSEEVIPKLPLAA